MARSPAWGMAFFGLFLLPFAAGGGAAGLAGASRIIHGDWREGIVLLLSGVIFAGFAVGGITLMLVGRRKLEEVERLRARHPDQPWRWRPEWSQGRIRDSTRAMVWVAWVFAALWNLVSIPVGFVGARSAVQEANPKLYLVLLFPLIGASLLVWAVRLTLRSLKYGTSWLELSTIPGTIGGGIAGTVRIPTAFRPELGFDATLRCLRRITTRSGKSSSTSERILWQEERRVPSKLVRDAAGAGVRVPVAFGIPADAQPSDSSNPRDEIVWRLTLAGSVPGVDYHAAFDVPVFRTGVSAEDLAELSDPGPPEPAYRQPTGSRISVSQNQRGTEIYFAAARNPGVAVGSTVFTIVWTALVPLLVVWEAPALFPLVFGLFAILLLAGVLQLWLGVSRVRADRTGVAIAQGYIATGRERRIEATDIADITLKIGMQAGITPYYDVVAVRKHGKRVILGRSLRDKREAELLVQMLKGAVGLTEPGASASSRPLLQA